MIETRITERFRQLDLALSPPAAKDDPVTISDPANRNASIIGQQDWFKIIILLAFFI